MRGLIIIPSYNEAGSIGSLLEELRPHLGTNRHALVVDDGSSDETSSIAKSHGYAVCTLPCNLGYTGALKTGLQFALDENYDWMAFIDADGQHRPEDLDAMIRSFEEQPVDLMVGSRWTENSPDQSSSTGRRLGMSFFSWLSDRLTGQRFTDTTNGLKLMTPSVAKELLSRNFGDFHAEVLIYLHDRGYRITEHPIVVRARETGSSMYGFQDLIFYPMKNLILIGIFRLNSWTLSKVNPR
jgi:glycosyltransferase involved in cell wall biosynthesis